MIEAVAEKLGLEDVSAIEAFERLENREEELRRALERARDELEELERKVALQTAARSNVQAAEGRQRRIDLREKAEDLQRALKAIQKQKSELRLDALAERLDQRAADFKRAVSATESQRAVVRRELSSALKELRSYFESYDMAVEASGAINRIEEELANAGRDVRAPVNNSDLDARLHGRDAAPDLREVAEQVEDFLEKILAAR